MTPEDFDRQMKALTQLAEAAAAKAINSTAMAMMAVQVQFISMLTRKGVLDAKDIDGFVKSIEAMSAVMATTSPETGKEFADIALQLRHYLFKSTDKAN